MSEMAIVRDELIKKRQHHRTNMHLQVTLVVGKILKLHVSKSPLSHLSRTYKSLKLHLQVTLVAPTSHLSST